MGTVRCDDCGNVNPEGIERCLACAYLLNFTATDPVPTTISAARPLIDPSKRLVLLLVGGFILFQVLVHGVINREPRFSPDAYMKSASVRNANRVDDTPGAPIQSPSAYSAEVMHGRIGNGLSPTSVSNLQFHEASWSKDTGHTAVDYYFTYNGRLGTGRYYQINFFSSSGRFLGYGNGFIEGSASISGTAVIDGAPASAEVTFP
jgi:hypothetical protein